MMKKNILLFLLLFIFAGSNLIIYAQPAGLHWWKSPTKIIPPFKSKSDIQLPLIQVKGNKLVNSLGDTILFRGFAISDPDKVEGQGKWNKDIFVKVKEMGATLLRIPIHPVAWRERTPEKMIEILDQAVEWCTELGIYIIIDWHSIGNLKTGLYFDPMYITSEYETFQFWQTIAGHYVGNNTVAFYEIFNEPTQYNNYLGRMDWAYWKKFNEDVIALIRAYNNETIPLVAAFDWAYDLSPLRFDPIEAERIAYVTHPYPNKRSQPWEPKWDENFGFASGTYPVIATEWGFGHISEGSTDGSDYGNRIINFLESKGISWCVWVFDPEWVPNMLESWDDFKLSPYGEFIKNALHRDIIKK
jgi:endoglucanase